MPYEKNIFSVRDPHEVVPYSPRFQDGWSPGVINFSFSDHYGHEPLSKRKSTISNSSRKSMESSSGNEGVRRQISSEEFDAYRDELMSMGAKIGLTTVAREAQNGKELTVIKGEYLEVLITSCLV